MTLKRAPYRQPNDCAIRGLNGDEIRRQRHQVIVESDMYRDAVDLCLLARKLDKAIDHFIHEHDGNASGWLLVEAGCELPTDITHEGDDPDRDMSQWVCDDITGFKWGLGRLMDALETHLSVPADPEDTETVAADGSQGADDASPVVVVGD